MADPAQSLAEPVRLVIWDLDETFWHGTLTEGGITARQSAIKAVAQLARRGIVSSICSKNNSSMVRNELVKLRCWRYFVFPDISWESKGPRLAAQIAAMQLRPQSVLFIDDNPLNRAEALRFVPGLQVADCDIVDRLLDDPRLAGKPDPEMTRLAQYRVLSKRHQAIKTENFGSNEDFLRDSQITVTIDQEIKGQLDRAIELINRTNQLNFTRRRLPEDIEAAREQLREQLSDFRVVAGLISVQDRYGDYGVAGFYMIKRGTDRKPDLWHFCFSCRILGMGVESWVYRWLNRPEMPQVSGTASDPAHDAREIDWITLRQTDEIVDAAQVPKLDYVVARGACEMRAISQYLRPFCGEMIEEVNRYVDGINVPANAAILASQAITGFPPQAIEAMLNFGFVEQDFHSILAAPPACQSAVWILGTASETTYLFSHRETGILMPLVLNVFEPPPPGPLPFTDTTGLTSERAAYLRQNFDYAGRSSSNLLKDSLELIFRHAPKQVKIFVVLSNEQIFSDEAGWIPARAAIARNAMICDLIKEKHQVEAIVPSHFMDEIELKSMQKLNHFNRLVYYRIFQHILARLPAE